MAIEDGFVLARAMEQYSNDIPKALRSYSAARIPRTTRVVNDSSENVKRYHHPALSDPSAAKDYVSKAWDEQQDLRAWIFAYDATTAPLGAQA
jgi:salicylate hydroxylase